MRRAVVAGRACQAMRDVPCHDSGVIGAYRALSWVDRASRAVVTQGTLNNVIAHALGIAIEALQALHTRSFMPLVVVVALSTWGSGFP